jgi:hypothetical protein
MANAWTINNSGGTAAPVVQKNSVTVPNVTGFRLVYAYDAAAETGVIGPVGERIELWLEIEDPAQLAVVTAQGGGALSGYTDAGMAVQPTKSTYQALQSGDTVQFVTTTVTSTGAGADQPV